MNRSAEPMIVWDEPNFAGRLLSFVGSRFRAAFGLSDPRNLAGKFAGLDERDVFLTEFSAPGASRSELKAALIHSLPELLPIPLEDAAIYVSSREPGVLHLAIMQTACAAELEKQLTKHAGFAAIANGENNLFHFARWLETSKALANGRLISIAAFLIACFGALSFLDSIQSRRLETLTASIGQQRADLLKQAELQSRQSQWQALQATGPAGRTPSARLADLILLKELTGLQSHWTSVSVEEGQTIIVGRSGDAISLLSAINSGIGEDRRAEFVRAVSIDGDGKQNFEIAVAVSEHERGEKMSALLKGKALQGWFMMGIAILGLWSVFAPKAFSLIEQRAEIAAATELDHQLGKRLVGANPVLLSSEDVQFRAIDQDYVLSAQRLILDVSKRSGATISEIRAEEVRSNERNLPPAVSIVFSFDGDLEAFGKLLEYLSRPEMFITVESYSLRPISVRGRADKQMRSEISLLVYRMVGGA